MVEEYIYKLLNPKVPLSFDDYIPGNPAFPSGFSGIDTYICQQNVIDLQNNGTLSSLHTMLEATGYVRSNPATNYTLDKLDRTLELLDILTSSNKSRSMPKN